MTGISTTSESETPSRVTQWLRLLKLLLGILVSALTILRLLGVI
jgi:hypothetical protein